MSGYRDFPVIGHPLVRLPKYLDVRFLDLYCTVGIQIKAIIQIVVKLSTIAERTVVWTLIQTVEKLIFHSNTNQVSKNVVKGTSGLVWYFNGLLNLLSVNWYLNPYCI
jgi:hypothetical protein